MSKEELREILVRETITLLFGCNKELKHIEPISAKFVNKLLSLFNAVRKEERERIIKDIHNIEFESDSAKEALENRVKELRNR